MVSSLPDVTLDFKEIEQNQIVLTSGKSEITLKGKDSEQYPRIQEISASTPLILETKLLKKIINENSFCCKYTRKSSNSNRCSFCIESTQGAKKQWQQTLIA